MVNPVRKFGRGTEPLPSDLFSSFNPASKEGAFSNGVKMVAKGSHYQIGCTVGKNFSKIIKRILTELSIPESYGEPAHQRLRTRLKDNLTAKAPHLLEEMQGISEGSGLPFEDILTYNCIAEMWRANGCSCVAFNDTQRGVAIGKTNDIGESKEHYHLPYWITLPYGRRMLIFTWPGTVWANAGVNEAGLGVASASVSSNSFNPAGIPSNMIYRLLLERCSSVPQVLELLPRIEFMCHPFNLICGDAQGNFAVIEADVYERITRYPVDGVLFCTNHWVTSAMQGKCTTDPKLLENSHHRFANFGRLTNHCGHSVARLKRILRDHSEKGSICQHGEAGMYTSVAYIVLPLERRILFTYGPPCRKRFREFSLNERGR